MLNCIDNSGAALVECVKVLKMKRAAKIGQPSTHSLRITICQRSDSISQATASSSSFKSSATLVPNPAPEAAYPSVPPTKSAVVISDTPLSSVPQRSTKDLTAVLSSLTTTPAFSSTREESLSAQD
jgi:hypothetical protein